MDAVILVSGLDRQDSQEGMNRKIPFRRWAVTSIRMGWAVSRYPRWNRQSDDFHEVDSHLYKDILNGISSCNLVWSELQLQYRSIISMQMPEEPHRFWPLRFSHWRGNCLSHSEDIRKINGTRLVCAATRCNRSPASNNEVVKEGLLYLWMSGDFCRSQKFWMVEPFCCPNLDSLAYVE